MKSCDYPGCEEEESLPFKCKLCNQMYCAKHRLPEQHDCPMIGIYQTEEYRKSKISQPRIQEEKSKKSKLRFRGESLKSPRETETKSVYFEPQDRFLARSSFFNITGFRNDWLNLLIALGVFSIISSLNILVRVSLYPNPLFTLSLRESILINLVGINFIFGGYFIVQKILAKRMKVGTRFVLWVWGIILGIISILVPIFVIPGFLLFTEGKSSIQNRGKIAFVGISWILFWCTAIIVLMLGWGSNIPYLFALGYTPSFMLSFVLISLLPFGTYAGKFISLWNKKLHIITFVYTFILFISYFVALTFQGF